MQLKFDAISICFGRLRWNWIRILFRFIAKKRLEFSINSQAGHVGIKEKVGCIFHQCTLKSLNCPLEPEIQNVNEKLTVIRICNILLQQKMAGFNLLRN